MSLTLLRAKQSIEDPMRTMTMRTTTNSELLLPFLASFSVEVVGAGQRVEWIEVYLSPGRMGSPLEKKSIILSMEKWSSFKRFFFTILPLRALYD